MVSRNRKKLKDKVLPVPSWKWLSLEFVTQQKAEKENTDTDAFSLFFAQVYDLFVGIFIVPDVSYETDGVLADIVCWTLSERHTAEAQVCCFVPSTHETPDWLYTSLYLSFSSFWSPSFNFKVPSSCRSGDG